VKIRDADNAVVDLARLRLYCLDPRHPRGVVKARQFEARLGMGSRDAELLQHELLKAIGKSEQAVAGRRDEYGQRYQLDVKIDGHGGTATVRTTWIALAGGRGPKFITCHVV